MFLDGSTVGRHNSSFSGGLAGDVESGDESRNRLRDNLGHSSREATLQSLDRRQEAQRLPVPRNQPVSAPLNLTNLRTSEPHLSSSGGLSVPDEASGKSGTTINVQSGEPTTIPVETHTGLLGGVQDQPTNGLPSRCISFPWSSGSHGLQEAPMVTQGPPKPKLASPRHSATRSRDKLVPVPPNIPPEPGNP